MITNIDLIVFVHAFAWIFVLSSVIPSVILGKRSILLQFLLVLVITLIAISVEDVITLFLGTSPTSQMEAMSPIFSNPLVAGTYLSTPYLFMLYLDLKSRKTAKGAQLTFDDCLIQSGVEGQGDKVEPTLGIQSTKYKKRRRINFLHGAALVCISLAFVTLIFGNIISRNLQFLPYKLVYTCIFMSMGVLLLKLAFRLPIVAIQGVASWTQDYTPSFPTETSEPTPPVYIERGIEEPQKEIIVDEVDLSEFQLNDVVLTIDPIREYDVRHPKEIIDSQC